MLNFNFDFDKLVSLFKSRPDLFKYTINVGAALFSVYMFYMTLKLFVPIQS
jgi:hypothetical protein